MATPSVSRATRRMGATDQAEPYATLLVSQGVDGVDAAGRDGGGDAEDDADGDRDAESDHHGGGSDDRLPFGGAGDQPGEEESEGNAQETAADGDEDGFGEELANDIPSSGSRW